MDDTDGIRSLVVGTSHRIRIHNWYRTLRIHTVLRVIPRYLICQVWVWRRLSLPAITMDNGLKLYEGRCGREMVGNGEKTGGSAVETSPMPERSEGELPHDPKGGKGLWILKWTAPLRYCEHSASQRPLDRAMGPPIPC